MNLFKSLWLLSYKMNTDSINLGNSKCSDKKLLPNLAEKLNLNRSGKFVVLSNHYQTTRGKT